MGGTQSKALSLKAVSRDRVGQWPRLLGAESLQLDFSPYYYRALSALPHADLTDEAQTSFRQISTDLPRLTPTQQHESLRAILKAFVLHCPSIGYLPSIACITSTLLAALHDAEQTFWCLIALMEYKFAGSPLGTAGFMTKEMDAFAALVEQRLPRVHARMLAEGLANFFAGMGHGLMVLGAAGWIGMLCSRVVQAQGDTLQELALGHACIDAVCLYGLDAAHLIGLTLLQRAEEELLRARDLEDLIRATTATAARVMSSAEGASELMATIFGAKSLRRSLRDVTRHRQRQRSLWERVAVSRPGGAEEHGACRPRIGGWVAAAALLAEPRRPWSPRMHALCDAPLRARVRTILMLQRRDVLESRLALVPLDLWIESILPHLGMVGSGEPSVVDDHDDDLDHNSEPEQWPDPW